MPKAAWKPSHDIEAQITRSSDGERVRCKICKDGAGNWIQKSTLKAHLGSKTHLQWLTKLEADKHQHEEQIYRLATAYDAPGVRDYGAEGPLGPSIVPSMLVPETDEPMDVSESAEISRMLEELCQSPAEPNLSPEECRGLVQQEFERMLLSAYQENEFGDDGESAEPSEEAPSGCDNSEDAEFSDPSVPRNPNYWPYPNKTVMHLDIMDNLPRCRFTTSHISLVLHLLKCLGAPDVPSLNGFRKIQKDLQAQCGSEPVKISSDRGNIFYMNDIRDTIARDFANPLVASKLQLYPEEVDGPVTETWQAERWKEYNPLQLTPTFTKGSKRFWIEELAQSKDGRYLIPRAWFSFKGQVMTDANVVLRIAGGQWTCLEEQVTVAADDLALDFDDIISLHGSNLEWTPGSLAPAMPNPMRQLVDEDEDLVVVMVSPWADDVSGNRSKQYNKHMNMYAQNGCLPGRLLQQEFHVHYVSSSPHASSAEQFAAFRDEINSTEKEPIRCFNAHTKRKCRCIIRTPGLPADNPQQSEEACHMGANANFPCRKCGWGGTQQEKESPETYHQCHLPGIARDAEQIRTALKEQLRLATFGDAKGVEEHQRACGTKDKVTQHWIEQAIAQAKAIKQQNPRTSPDSIAAQVQAWLDEQPGDKMNPLLDIAGLDPSQDTPVELLHTVLLGVIKYIWHLMNTTQWSDNDRYLLAIRLQSTDISGLKIPPLRASYMVQYRNNLIGKHFKTLMQTLAFCVHDIATPEQFTLIRAAGDLGARLWISEIDDMESYLSELKIAIANLLDAFDAVDPLRIIVKIKLHVLTHIPDDIRRFGPASRFSTEIYEAYNAVFRLCSVYSNHLAPSRDISRKFASMERIKHMLSGGHWWSEEFSSWVQSGQQVRRVLMDEPVFQRHLGWVSPDPPEPGFVRLASIQKAPQIPWMSTKASLHWDAGSNPPSPDSIWRIGEYVATQSGDRASTLSWVYAVDTQGRSILGRIAEIIAGPKRLVTLEQFVCSEARHPDFGWPVVRRPNGAEIIADVRSYCVLESSRIQFACSVQHDCGRGACKPSIIGKERQEREETTRDRKLINHTDDDHFIMNMAGVHNFALLLRKLPKSLTELHPLHLDRKTFHKKASEKAHVIRGKKRKTTADKRRATAAQKKKEAERLAAEAEAAAEAAERAEAGEDTESNSDSEEERDGEHPEAESGSEQDEDTEHSGEESIADRIRKRKRQRRG